MVGIKRRDFLMVSAVAAVTPAMAEPEPEHRVWADENSRNARGSEIFKTMVSEAFKPTQFIAAHHLIYQRGTETQEFPSADTLIFDHDVARIVWGDGFKEVLMRLVCEPTKTRDDLLAQLLAGRGR